MYIKFKDNNESAKTHFFRWSYDIHKSLVDLLDFDIIERSKSSSKQLISELNELRSRLKKHQSDQDIDSQILGLIEQIRITKPNQIFIFLDKRGRNKESANNKRTQQINFRVTPDELENITQMAAASNLSITEYLIQKATTSGSINRITRPETTKKTFGLLLKVSNNHNQIAHRLNANQAISSPVLEKQMDEVIRVQNLLLKELNI